MINYKAVNLDMDGTIVDFYGVDNWLDYLIAEDTTPYEICKPKVNFSQLARQLNRLQKIGYEINIISWLSKNGSDDFNFQTKKAKENYLKKHLPSVKFNNVTIVKYGTPKYTCGKGILFDDEERNRTEWLGIAYDEKNLLEILKNLK